MRKRAWAFAVLAILALPTQGFAHQGDPNFRSELTGVTPPIEGVDVEILNYDDSLHLTNRSGRAVTVEGYEGEPYVRLLADGTVQVNLNSPSHYLNEDRFGKVEVPASADAGAPPDWRTVDGTGQYSWHDHRIHYMATGTPRQVKDEGERTPIFDYRVPIRVGDRPAAISGTLFWAGGEESVPVAPFAALGLALLALVAFTLVRRARRGSRDSGSGEAW